MKFNDRIKSRGEKRGAREDRPRAFVWKKSTIVRED